MIKKLRLKFILISIISLVVFLGIILGVVNIINYSNVAKDADNITAELTRSGGEFKPDPMPWNEDFNPFDEKRGIDRPEMQYDTRYFSVKLSKDGEVLMVNTFNTIMYDDEEAIEFALSVYKSEGVGWEGTFRYRVSKVDDGILIVSADFARELAPSKTVLITSLIVFGAGILISLLVLLGISNLVVNPVKEATDKQKQFISNASHELKTPITIISANNELIELEKGETEETNNISRQVRKLSTIAQSLNNLSNIDEINKISEFNKFDLSSLIIDTAEPFIELFKKDNKELTLDISPEINFKGNEKMIKELVSIILENAYKYSKTNALFSLKEEENRITILSKNDSDDIKDGELDEVFERFYRSDDVRAKAIEGSGLGLSIAKEITKLHGGRIKAKGEEGYFLIRVEF